jgi:hypothetical protein
MTNPDAINIIEEQLPVVYDEAFTVKAQPWGTFVSRDLDGKALVTSLSEEGCIDTTRWYLKGRQEGFMEVVNQYDGTVAGKL